MTHSKFLLPIVLSLYFLPTQAISGCLDGLTTSASIHSKIRGFYINTDSAGEDSIHYVILDKATCVASKFGDATLGNTTINHLYLRFTAKDKTLFSSLISAQARDITVEFRMKATTNPGSVNEIAYIVTPSGARNQ